MEKAPESRLANLLRAQEGELTRALQDAETELAALDARREQLRTLVSSIRAALATLSADKTPEPPAPSVPGHLTLHDAMAQVLRHHGKDGLTARELADEINEQRLYRKRDGSPVEINQVHARTNNYSQLFEKDRGRIRLRSG